MLQGVDTILIPQPSETDPNDPLVSYYTGVTSKTRCTLDLHLPALAKVEEGGSILCSTRQQHHLRRASRAYNCAVNIRIGWDLERPHYLDSRVVRLSIANRWSHRVCSSSSPTASKQWLLFQGL
jgi:hypothetical protein